MLLLFHAGAALANTGLAGEEAVVYESKKFALGVGLGIVEFDSKIKVTSNITGKSRFIDLEGNLNLPNNDKVNTIYGAYRFNEKHSLVFGYFSIDRESTVIKFSEDYDDIIVVEANVGIEDNSRFYNLGYGYNLFHDDRSDVTLVIGLKGLELKLEAEARGEIKINDETRSEVEIAEVDVLAPLPLLGLNFGFGFTPEWSISTQIRLVGGSYQDVSARVLETSVTSRYQFARHAGILLGLTYFDANVDVDDEDLFSEVSYAYSGVFVGLHFGL